jgi:GT2 family glycosyltransferase
MGFIRATNSGITASIGEYILFLNNDAQILDWGKDGWIRMLKDPLDDDPSIAATGSNKDAWAINRWFIVGFCLMTRRRLLFQMGLLDETFGIGCGEDCDYCLKVQSEGYKIKQVPVETDHWSTQFPIWHIGHVTLNTVQGDGEINTKILEHKYPRNDKDREFVKKYSEGWQNIF